MKSESHFAMLVFLQNGVFHNCIFIELITYKYKLIVNE